MDQHTQTLIADINVAVCQLRGLYSKWAKKHNISYNEMLVFYIIREYGFCTQKQVCDSYLLPRQTINHVIAGMRKNNILCQSKEKSRGREKAFVLTEYGKEYASPLFDSLNKMEIQAIDQLGSSKMKEMIALIGEYGNALNRAIEEVI
jgi:DNA-binding MarR family transcriptional regulator